MVGDACLSSNTYTPFILGLCPIFSFAYIDFMGFFPEYNFVMLTSDSL